jgi:hypothetical protein
MFRDDAFDLGQSFFFVIQVKDNSADVLIWFSSQPDSVLIQ